MLSTRWKGSRGEKCYNLVRDWGRRLWGLRSTLASRVMLFGGAFWHAHLTKMGPLPFHSTEKQGFQISPSTTSGPLAIGGRVTVGSMPQWLPGGPWGSGRQVEKRKSLEWGARTMIRRAVMMTRRMLVDIHEFFLWVVRVLSVLLGHLSV